MVCILAAFYNQEPEEIVFHSNLDLAQLESQPRWKRLTRVIGAKLKYQKASKPTHVFGSPIGNVYHANDVYKIRHALKHGGIFLDQDTFIVKNLDPLREHEVTLGWPEDEYIGIQCILAKPNATFIRLWLESYRDYRPSIWYYNGGEYPTKKILFHCPNLIHREKELLGVKNLAKKLYGESNWAGWKDFYAIHLLFRHRTYLVEEDVEQTGIEDFDEENIVKYGRTFGQMARSVLDRDDYSG